MSILYFIVINSNNIFIHYMFIIVNVSIYNFYSDSEDLINGEQNKYK